MEDGKTGAIISAEQFFEELKNGSSGLMPGWRILPPEGKE
jgi:hypothetical protein